MSQTTTCSDGSIGYNSIEGLQNEIDAEVDVITAGGPQEAMYLYRLCPDTDFTVTDDIPLVPLLDGSVFQCGEGGPNQNCRFSGGTNQVSIGPSQIPNYVIEDIRFQGVTFTGFTMSAVSGTATEDTTVTFDSSNFVVSHCMGDMLSCSY